MDRKKLLIGYDLNDKAVQISVFYQGKAAPVTLSTVAGEHKYQIPTVLGRDSGGHWFYGTKAKKAATLHEGTAVDGLIALALAGKEVSIEGENYRASYLLVRFIKETLKFAVSQTGIEDIEAIVFSVPEAAMELSKMLKGAASSLELSPECIFVQDYSESFYYYVASQAPEYHSYQVLLFWFEDEGIKSFELSHEDGRSRRLMRIEEGPSCRITRQEEVVPLIAEEEYRELRDKSFLKLCQKVFGKKLVSTVFLVGDGFDGGWMKESLSFLCQKRRVFQGKNLFTKGACYGARSKNENRSPGGYVYLSPQRVAMSVGLKVRNGGAEEELMLIRGGENWYEAAVSRDIIVGEDKELSVLLLQSDKGERREQSVSLNDLPKRPAKTLRLGLCLQFTDRQSCRLRLEDKGFGPAFPATGYTKEVTLRWEQ